MRKIMKKVNWTIENSKSILAFETTGNSNWEQWDRYLSIDGKPAYHIGNVCGTCSFFFERLEGANRSVSPKQVTEELKRGISNLDETVIKKVEPILPNGKYIVTLSNIQPSIVELGTSSDYFSNEQTESWGVDSFWGFPHHPKVKYYRTQTSNLKDGRRFFEFVVPMFPQGWLDNDTIEGYLHLINSGNQPTALAISVLDIKEPVDMDEGYNCYEHWCLTHYLIDGHHKVFASNGAEKPITLLSFLLVSQSIASEEDLNILFKEV